MDWYLSPHRQSSFRNCVTHRNDLAVEFDWIASLLLNSLHIFHYLLLVTSLCDFLVSQVFHNILIIIYQNMKRAYELRGFQSNMKSFIWPWTSDNLDPASSVFPCITLYILNNFTMNCNSIYYYSSLRTWFNCTDWSLDGDTFTHHTDEWSRKTVW